MKKFRRPLDVFDSEVLDCIYGHYPWDDWERDALAAGVPEELGGPGPVDRARGVSARMGRPPQIPVRLV